jgi:Uma2 family endonuclease
LYVVGAPFAVHTDSSDEVQSDVLIARFDELTDKNLPAAPALAVEVLSPGGRLIEVFEAHQPFKVSVVPAGLLGRLRPG